MISTDWFIFFMVVVLIKLSNVFLATVRHLSIFSGVYSVLITLLYLHRPIDVRSVMC